MKKKKIPKSSPKIQKEFQNVMQTQIYQNQASKTLQLLKIINMSS